MISSKASETTVVPVSSQDVKNLIVFLKEGDRKLAEERKYNRYGV